MIVGENIRLTSVQRDGEERIVVCTNRNTGAISIATEYISVATDFCTTSTGFSGNVDALRTSVLQKRLSTEMNSVVE